MCLILNLFNLPFLQVSDLGEPLAFCWVLLQFQDGGFDRPVGVPHGFVSGDSGDSGVQVSSPVGVQVLPRLLVDILGTHKHVTAHFKLTFDKAAGCSFHFFILRFIVQTSISSHLHAEAGFGPGERQNFDLHLLAFGDYVSHVGDTSFFAQLRDVHQTLPAFPAGGDSNTQVGHQGILKADDNKTHLSIKCHPVMFVICNHKGTCFLDHQKNYN